MTSKNISKESQLQKGLSFGGTIGEEKYLNETKMLCFTYLPQGPEA